ncbi:hypothetical protein [Actinoallomurus rhizosphaericola]|uniref:hypothetical protein n=1 Tax=Actinoallomurus rhizosphaericola TaxID=2952536 RepID=UPI0020914225|nr:hypothetical protein [Actinoallomurus rhizosphaericola]MCO5991866.1 hypothetical protein [Actinoallomurus rhizosphaericola]
MREVRRRTIRAAAGGLALTAVAAAVPATAAIAGTNAAPAAKAAPAVKAAASPKWQLFDVPVQGKVSLLSVAATGTDDAWAGGLLLNPQNPPHPPETPGLRRLAKDPSQGFRQLAKAASDEDDDNCTFAKGMFTSVMLHWDGHSWQQTPVPSSARINHLSASTPNDAWASTDCGMLHWDGRNWTAVPIAPVHAQQVGTEAIKAISPTEAWLTGSTYDNTTQVTRAFVQRWDGRKWRDVPLPALGDNFALDNMDARRPNDVWAAGTVDVDNDVHPDPLLLLHWNGRTWKRFPAPETGEWTKFLMSVRAVAKNNVWIAGWGKHAPGIEEIRRPMLLHWNGHKWTSEKAPDERGELYDVAVSRGQALAVGDTFSPSEPDYTMYALRRTSSGWQHEPVPVEGEADLWALAPIPGGGIWSVGTAGDYRPVIARRR